MVASTSFELDGTFYTERAPEADGVFVSGVLTGLRLDPASVFAAVDRVIENG